MHSERRFRILLVVSIVLVLLFGCAVDETVSRSERINKFLSDVRSNDFGSLYLHIHPDNPQRGQLKDAATWTPSPFPVGSYSFSGISGSGSTRTVTVQSSPGSGLNGDVWTFTMKEDDKDVWYIDRLVSDGAGGVIVSN